MAGEFKFTRGQQRIIAEYLRSEGERIREEAQRWAALPDGFGLDTCVAAVLKSVALLAAADHIQSLSDNPTLQEAAGSDCSPET